MCLLYLDGLIDGWSINERMEGYKVSFPLIILWNSIYIAGENINSFNRISYWEIHVHVYAVVDNKSNNRENCISIV